MRQNGLVYPGGIFCIGFTYQEQKGHGPHEEQLQRDELGLVDLRIAAMASDEYVSVGREGEDYDRNGGISQLSRIGNQEAYLFRVMPTMLSRETATLP